MGLADNDLAIIDKLQQDFGGDGQQNVQEAIHVSDLSIPLGSTRNPLTESGLPPDTKSPMCGREVHLLEGVYTLYVYVCECVCM